VYSKDERRLRRDFVNFLLVKSEGLPVDGVVTPLADVLGGATQLLALGGGESGQGDCQRAPKVGNVRSAALDQNDLTPPGINN